MAAEYGYQSFVAMAESLGFKLLIDTDKEDPKRQIFILQHQLTNTEISLDDVTGIKVLVFLNTAHWAPVSQALETRIARLEALLIDTNRDIQTLATQDEYLHYLKQFYKKKPLFEEYGLTLTIDEKTREVVYQNGRRHPVHYPINHAGYNQALRVLNHAKNKRKKQEQAAASDDLTLLRNRIDELRMRAEHIGNKMYIDPMLSEGIDYRRGLYKAPDAGKSGSFIFTKANVLNPKHTKGLFPRSWRFSISELDELERFIAHDERIYAEAFNKPN